MCYYVFIILRQYKWLIKRDEGDVVKMKLVFYGAGNMAQAIFTGIINSNNLDPNDIYLTNKSNEQALKDFAERLGVNYSYDDKELLKNADYVFLERSHMILKH